MFNVRGRFKRACTPEHAGAEGSKEEAQMTGVKPKGGKETTAAIHNREMFSNPPLWEKTRIASTKNPTGRRAPVLVSTCKRGKLSDSGRFRRCTVVIIPLVTSSELCSLSLESNGGAKKFKSKRSGFHRTCLKPAGGRLKAEEESESGVEASSGGAGSRLRSSTRFLERTSAQNWLRMNEASTNLGLIV